MTKMRIVIAPDGKTQIAVIDGEFQAGSAAIRDMLDAIGADGVTIVPEGQVEQHTHHKEEVVRGRNRSNA